MPYISTETVKERRKLIREALKGYKVSVTCRNYSKISVKIVSGPMDLLKGCEPSEIKDGYETVNPFWYDKHYQDFPEKKELIDTIMNIANYGNRTVVVDGDYGNIPQFYVGISIGEWDKPYVQTKK